MVRMRAYKKLFSKKRKGFTLVEEAIVIAVIAILAVPVVFLLRQSIRNQVYQEKNLKGQYYANIIMQDFERRIRRAESGSIVINSASTYYQISFSYADSDINGNYVTDTTYYYEIDNPDTKNSLFYRWTANTSKSVYPTGLPKGIIRNFELVSYNIDLTTGPPYYVVVKISTSEGFVLQKTIYLVNY